MPKMKQDFPPKLKQDGGSPFNPSAKSTGPTLSGIGKQSNTTAEGEALHREIKRANKAAQKGRPWG